MNTELFTVKGQYNDLEIETLDENIKYYTIKGWLAITSEYFRAMLTNGMAESQSNTIKLNYSPKIVLTLLCCVHQGYLGEEYLKKNYFEKLDSLSDVCEFFSACNEYQFDSIKNLFEKYCSIDEQLVSLYGKDAIELIKNIYLLDLKIMEEKLHNIIEKNPKMIESIKYETMECKYINFFTGRTWPIFVNVLISWLKCHDPTDKELIDAEIHLINYNDMPKNLCEKLILAIRKLDKKSLSRSDVQDKILYALYPDPIENKK